MSKSLVSWNKRDPSDNEWVIVVNNIVNELKRSV